MCNAVNWPTENPARAPPEAAKALVKGSPDAIFAPGTVTAKAAQMATKTIPIITMTEDMVADGLPPVQGQYRAFLQARLGF